MYALIRIVTLFWPDAGIAHEVLLWVACATMLIGVLGAAAQVEVRRILSFHIVSQVGYMILGLALAPPLALAGAVFYLIHHIVVKANLFFIGGIAARLTGWHIDIKSETLAADILKNVPVHEEPAADLIGDEEDEDVRRCEYVSEDGVQCRNQARPGSRFCGVHDTDAFDDAEDLI